ncbi:unnamed protein product [Miscanthus lutarioriparius]|uniref:Flavin-containing monooxygenase n=1 Tax=Miscanthus lutarioriparius TaxID=422564 RepID=A0A811NH35_9POAL|nr:unnamed protein product [Miscanthus lutarioriparius]
MASSSKKVCVVGAGVAGLVSARELRREDHDVAVMEQSGGVGGQWLYDPRTDATDPLGVAGAQSSIYASLRLNTPRETTAFSDFPFFPSNDGTGDARRYPVHAEFLRYIRDFCDAFGLMDAVRLNTKVLHVGPLAPRAADDGGVKRWTVRWSSRHGDSEGEVVTAEEVFDAVVVAVGQNSQRRLPSPYHQRHVQVEQEAAAFALVPGPGLVPGPSGGGGLMPPERHGHRAGALHGGKRGAHQRQVHGRRRRVPGHEASCVQAPQPASPPPGMSSLLVHGHQQHTYMHIIRQERLCVRLLVPVPGHGRPGHRRRQPHQPAVRAHVPAGAGAVALLRGRAQKRGGAAVLRGAGEVGGAGAIRPEVAAAGGRHAPLRGGVQPRKGDGRRAQAPDDDIFDLEYCDAFGETHCGFPRLEDWKNKLLWSSVKRVRDATESFRDDYRDSDLVLEGLRSQGWLTGRPPPPPEDTRVENES